MTRSAVTIAILLALAHAAAPVGADTTTDEAEIYRLILVGVLRERPARQVVVVAETSESMMYSVAYTKEGAYSHFAFLSDEVFKDFETKLASEVRHADLSHVRDDIVLVSRDTFEVLFEPGGGRWEEFYRRYPDSQGITVLSHIGFDSKHQVALVYSSTRMFDLAAEGKLYAFTKVNGKWTLRKELSLWMS